MNITITVGPWIVPASITVAWFLTCALIAYGERNDHGFGAGLGTAMALFFGAITVGVSWAAYILMRWLS